MPRASLHDCRLIAVLAALLVSSICALESTNTWNIHSTNAPGLSTRAHVIYDNKVIFFPEGYVNDWDSDVRTHSHIYRMNNTHDFHAEFVRTSGPAPPIRDDFVVDLYGDKVIFFGGLGLSYLADLHILDLLTLEWTTITPNPGPAPGGRRLCRSFIYNDLFYIYSGSSESESLTDMWTYNLGTNTWEEVIYGEDTNSPSYYAFAFTVYKDILYVYSGRDAQYYYAPEMWKFDLRTNIWTVEMLDTMNNPVFVCNLCAFARIDNSLILMHGYAFIESYLPDPLITVIDLDALAIVYTYVHADETQAYPYQADYPMPRAFAAGINYNQEFLLVGGQYDCIDDTFWVFDLQSKSFVRSSLSVYPIGRRQQSIVKKNEIEFLMFGGENYCAHGYYLNDLWSYNLETRKWTNVSPIILPEIADELYPPGTVRSTAAYYKDNFYLIGGVTNSYSPMSVSYRYSFESRLWEVFEIALGYEFLPLSYDTAALLIGTKLHIWGGSVLADEYSSFEYLDSDHVFVIDFEEKTVGSILPANPIPARTGSSSFTFDGMFCIQGGLQIDTEQADMSVYCLQKDDLNYDWLFYENSQNGVARKRYTKAAFAGMLIHIGGEDPAGDNTNDMWFYDFDNKLWGDHTLPTERIPPFVWGVPLVMGNQIILPYVSIPSHGDNRVFSYTIGRAFCSGTQQLDRPQSGDILSDGSGDLSYFPGSDCAWSVSGINYIMVKQNSITKGSNLKLTAKNDCAAEEVILNGVPVDSSISLTSVAAGSWINIPGGKFQIDFLSSFDLVSSSGFIFEMISCRKGFTIVDGVCQCPRNHYITPGLDCVPCYDKTSQPNVDKTYCFEDEKSGEQGVDDNISVGSWSFVRESMPFCKYSRGVANSQEAYFACLFEGDTESSVANVPVKLIQIHSTVDQSWSFVSANNEAPSSRVGSCFATHQSSIYYAGGLAISQSNRFVYEFHTTRRVWIKKAEALFNRQGHTCAVFDNCIFMHGGEDAEGIVSSDLEVYHMDKNSWSHHEWKLSPALTNHAAWIYQDSLFIYGGFDGIQELDTIYSLQLVGNIGDNAWDQSHTLETDACLSCETSPDRCQLPRQQMMVTEADGFIIVFGGYYRQQALRDLIMIRKDTLTMEFRDAYSKADVLPLHAPPPTYLSATLYFNGTVVVFGGFGSDESLVGNWIWTYALDKETWVSSLSSREPLPRRHHSMVHVGTGFIVFGGLLQLSTPTPTNDMWYFSEEHRRWYPVVQHLTIEHAPRPRSGCCILRQGEYIYVVGGQQYPGDDLDSLWRINITRAIQGNRDGAGVWERVIYTSTLKVGENILEKTDFSCVSHAHHTFIWGGQLTIRTGVFEDYKSVYVIDLKEHAITIQKAVAKTPIPRYHHDAAIYEKGFVIYGGRDFKGRPLKDLWMYSVDSQTWTNLESSSSTTSPLLYQSSMNIFGDNLVLVGGTNDDGFKTNDTWIYQISTSTWMKAVSASASQALPRLASHATVRSNDSVLIYGGSASTYLNSNILRYRPGICNSNQVLEMHGSRQVSNFTDGSGNAEYPGNSECYYSIKNANFISINASLGVSGSLTINTRPGSRSLSDSMIVNGDTNNLIVTSQMNHFSITFRGNENFDSTVRGSGFTVKIIRCPSGGIFDGYDCSCEPLHYEDISSGSCVKCKEGINDPACDGMEGDSGSTIMIGVVTGVASAIVLAIASIGGYVYSSRLKKIREREEQLFVHVKFSELEFGALLGAGSFGEVYIGVWRGSEVAIKRINPNKVNKESIANFKDEIAVMVQLRHPNIVLYMAACMEPNRICIISEYMVRGSLHDILHKETFEMDLPLKLSLLSDASKGLQYLHLSTPPILHRDLKSPNLLLDEKLNLKISDFGLTGIQNKRTKDKEPPGTLLWMAPEVILGEDYTEKADIYSFGIIIWEVFSRQEPYEGEEVAESIAIRVAKEGLRPDRIPDAEQPVEFRSLMESCWDNDMNKRPTFTSILKTMNSVFDPSNSSMSFSMGLEGSILSGQSMSRVKKTQAPSGQMAIVFTDVQSSTNLWERYHDEMANALLLHNEVMRTSIRTNHGYEVRTEGDAFMVVFKSVVDAFGFCSMAQEGLLATQWPQAIFAHPSASMESVNQKVIFRGLRVRMGIHWGEPLTRDDPITGRVEYFGQVVHRANSIANYPKGGQIVLSEAAFEAVQAELMSLGSPHIKDLGSITLKDEDHPERLYEMTPASLAARSLYFNAKHELGNTLVSHSQADTTLGEMNSFGQGASSWAIELAELVVSQQEIGTGSIGSLLKGTYKGAEVAVRMLSKQRVPDKMYFSLLAEVNLMISISHPNIVRFLGANLKSPRVCLLFEYAPLGSLSDVIYSGKVNITDPWRREVLKQVADAMWHLHSQTPAVYHRALKSRNVIISSIEPLRVKVGDYGLSRLRSDNRTMTKSDTKAWIAPEILRGGKHDSKSDVYSFGILAWELVAKQKPFSGIDSLRLSFEVVNGLRPVIPKSSNPTFTKIMQSCWDASAEQRPSFDSVKAQLG